MTKEEVSQYIFDKKIPLSFKHNNHLYYGYLINGSHITKFHKYISSIMFPNWSYYNYHVYLIKYFKLYSILLNIEKDSMEQCLGEFLIWWEINKSNCTDIEYYEIKKPSNYQKVFLFIV